MVRDGSILDFTLFKLTATIYKNIFLMPITSNYRLIIINGPSDK